MRPPSVRYTVSIAALLAWGVPLAGIALGYLSQHLAEADVGAFAFSAASYWQGGSLYAPHPSINLNPPHASVLLFSPLLLVDLQTAVTIWTLVNIAAVTASVWLIAAELRLAPSRIVAVAAVLIASEPFRNSLAVGQLGGILMLLATLAWRAHRRGQWSPVLALAVSLKPWLAPVILLQKPRHAAATIGLGLAGISVGVLTLGSDQWWAWLAALEQHGANPTPANASLLSAALMLFPGSELARAAWGGLSVALVGMTLLSKRGDADRDWLLVGLAAILVSPLGWAYYLLALAGPFVAWGERHRWPTASLAAIGILLLSSSLLKHAYIAGLTPIGAAYTVALLLLWREALVSRADAKSPASLPVISSLRGV